MVQWLWEEGREGKKTGGGWEGTVWARKRPKHATGIRQSTTYCRKYALYAKHTGTRPLPRWDISTVVHRVKSPAGSLHVCVRQRQVGQFVWRAAKRFSYPLHNLPLIPRHTLIGGGRGCTASGRQKASLLLPPFYVSFSPHLSVFSSFSSLCQAPTSLFIFLKSRITSPRLRHRHCELRSTVVSKGSRRVQQRWLTPWSFITPFNTKCAHEAALLKAHSTSVWPTDRRLSLVNPLCLLWTKRFTSHHC